MGHDPSNELSNGDGLPQSGRRVDYLFFVLLLFALLAVLIAIVAALMLILVGIVKIPLQSLPSILVPPSERQLAIYTAFFLVIALVFLLSARWKIQRNRRYQFSNGCIVCQQHDMIRIHRQRYHRWLAAIFQLPIRKYACRNCQWQGVMLFYPTPGLIVEDDSESILWQEFSIQPAQWQVTGETKTIQDSTVLHIAVVDTPVDEDPGTAAEENSTHISVSEVSPLEEPSNGEGGLAAYQSGDLNCEELTISRAVVVAPFGVSLRAAPENNAQIICSLEQNTIVGLFELVDDHSAANWRRVCCDGQAGWVSAAFLRHLQD